MLNMVSNHIIKSKKGKSGGTYDYYCAARNHSFKKYFSNNFVV
jgi:hypothetical protein